MSESLFILLAALYSGCALCLWALIKRCRSWFRALALVGELVVPVAFLAIVPLGINLTRSMPLGIYRLSAVNRQQLHRGDIVVVCLPTTIARFAHERGYLGSGTCAEKTEPLLKRIAATAGDVVTVTARGVAVNGTLLPESRPVALDVQGRPLVPRPPGRVVIAPGTVWLTGEHPRSWDSRYWGPVRSAQIIAFAAPLFVLGPAPQQLP